MQISGGKGRPWSKVPLGTGWERVISGNSCPKGLLEDVNEMRVVKAKLEEIKRAHPNVADTVRKDAFRRILELRSRLRVGIPKVLNVWSTHQFWIGFLTALGIDPRHIVFSSDTSEEQSRQFGKGRGTVDCCYPVKCVAGHYGELLFGQKHQLNILLSPMISSLPSFLLGHVADTLACPRVMAAPENIKAGFTKERDTFKEHGIDYVDPFVSLGDPPLVPKQLYQSLRDAIPELTFVETRAAVACGIWRARAIQHTSACQWPRHS